LNKDKISLEFIKSDTLTLKDGFLRLNWVQDGAKKLYNHSRENVFTFNVWLDRVIIYHFFMNGVILLLTFLQ